MSGRNHHTVNMRLITERRSKRTLAEGMTGMMENVFINVKNKSKTITAEVEVSAPSVAHDSAGKSAA